MNAFHKFLLESPGPPAMPLAMYPGLWLTGAKVLDIVTRSAAQLEAQAALQERYHTRFALSAMDLSIEAEAFGCQIALSDHEVPTITGKLVNSLEAAQRLPIPQPGDHRTHLPLETAKALTRLPGQPLVLGNCIGPFSLAVRLVGVSEGLELTLAQPQLIHTLLEKSSAFLTSYLQAFKAAGAAAVLMAEPAAGLLSPTGMRQFSSAHIRQIAASVCDQDFSVVLHNCAAKLPHLSALLESGLQTFHFGAPMDVAAALRQVPKEVVLCGNLDPAAVFVQSTPAQVATKTHALAQAVGPATNFLLSSGCDLPATVPLPNLDAFYGAVNAPSFKT